MICKLKRCKMQDSNPGTRVWRPVHLPLNHSGFLAYVWATTTYSCVSLSNQQHNYSTLLQNMGWLGRIWRGWTRNISWVVLLGFLYLSDTIAMFFIGIHIIYNQLQLYFWSKQPQLYSVLLQNIGCLGRIWWGLTIHLSLFALPGFMYLSDERMMIFCWSLDNLQP